MSILSQETNRLFGPGRLPDEDTIRKHRSLRPTARSSLADRLALSQVGIAPAALLHHIPQSFAPATGHVVVLNGTISGTFVTIRNPHAVTPPSPVSNPVAGTTTTFRGSGTITGLGAVEVTGSLVTSANAVSPHVTVETFTLTTAKGSVTLELKKSPGSPATAATSFSIVKATGAFQGDTGAGTADLKMFSELIPVVPPVVLRGVFTLTLHYPPPSA
jgi:hypothetical protein